MKAAGTTAIEVIPRDVDHLVADEDGFEAAVLASPDVDGFCSGHAFSVSAFKGLLPGREPRVYEVSGQLGGPPADGPGGGWLAFARREAALFGDTRPRELWEPFEAMWGLGCPVLGGDPGVLAAALAEVLRRDAPRATVLICGVRKGGERIAMLADALSGRHRLLLGSPTARVVAALDGGEPAFMSRRSPRFRANLRRALRDADRRGVTHERVVPEAETVAGLYARAVAVDDRSWKGRADAGLRATGLHDFYAEMLPRLARRGALRMHFLVDPSTGNDVAYLFGGISGDTFRGLQFAFAAGEEQRSLGNVIQHRAITALCAEGVARYDLGTLVDYKRHWGEVLDETLSLIAVPRAP